jgi:hypothetical protein
MARKKRTAQPLEGADEFMGADPEKEAIEKIAAARAAAEKEKEADEKKGDNGGPILDREAWRRAANEAIAEDLEISKLQEAIAECRGRLSSIRKYSKSLGVDWDVVSAYRRKAKRIRNGELGAMVTETRLEIELGHIMDCPLYTQFEMFKLPDVSAEGAPPKPGMDAELQGQHAWRNNEPISNNPFTPGSEDFVAWEQGHNNAMSAAARQMGSTEVATH